MGPEPGCCRQGRRRGAAHPKLREGLFFPALLEPRRRIDRALLAVVAEMAPDAMTTVASVLYVLREAMSLATAMKQAVALGGDTDTTAAIVGGILGCQLQDVTADIPWLPRVLLPESALIEATVVGLHDLRQSLCP
jgi:ADP-ribosylglycohydrolase/Transposase, Mutator family